MDRPPLTARERAGPLLGERNVVRYRLTEGDPLSAKVDCEVEVELGRGDWRTAASSPRSKMTCDAERFLVTTRLDALRGRPARRYARALDARDPAGRRMSDDPVVLVRGPAVARRERDRIFRRSWQYAGRAAS